MPGAGLTETPFRQVLSEMLALKPYWGKPTVRDFRGDDGNVGIIRSPVRAIVLPDQRCQVNYYYLHGNICKNKHEDKLRVINGLF
jgi:hypothetical protein